MLSLGCRRIAIAVLFGLLVFRSPAGAAEVDRQPASLSEEQKMERIRGFFESEYQEEDYFRTDRLLLTATKRNLPIRKAPAIVSVITREEIRYMGARDLRDVLTMVPGIGVSRNEFGIFMYEVRGIRTQLSEKILVMIDGHSLNKSIITGSSLYRIFGDMPVRNIKQIEIIRGPGSALYGANAFVAVINIITRDSVDVNGIELSGSVESFGTRNVSLVGGTILDNGFQMSGSIDIYKSDGENFLIEKDALFGAPFAATPGYANTETDKTDLFFKASYRDVAFKAHFISSQLDGFYIGFNHALTDENTDPISNFWSELSYTPRLTDRLQATFKIYYDYFDQDTSAELFPEGFMLPLPSPPFPADSFFVYPDGMIGGPKVKNQTVGGELQLDYDLSASNHLVFGTMYERTRQYDVEAFNNFNPITAEPLDSVQNVTGLGNWNMEEDRNVWALYIQDEWAIRDNLNLTAGVRHDHYSDFGNTTNPRVGLVWGFLEKADLKLLYGQAFRAPNFAELYNQNNPVNKGNANLNPETIKTYEVGTTVRLRKHFTVDFNYFHNDIDDLIVWDPTNVPPAPALYVNAGTAEVNGIELILSGNYTTNDYWKISYTYQDPEDGNTGADLPYVPRHRATANINFGLGDYLTLHADVLWTGSRPREAGDTRLEMDSYTVVDLAVTAERFYKNLELQLAVHNILDEDYRDPDTSGPPQLVPNDFPRAGRSILGELKYTF